MKSFRGVCVIARLWCGVLVLAFAAGRDLGARSVSGVVRSGRDSSAIPGAMVLLHNDTGARVGGTIPR